MTPRRVGSTSASCQIIESTAHGKIKQPERVRSDKIEVRRVVVIVVRLRKLPELHPPKIQSHNSTFREIDTALLFIFNGNALRLMSDQIENRRGASDRF